MAVSVRAFDSNTKEEVAVGRTYGDTLSLYLPPKRYDLLAKPIGGSAVNVMTINNVESLENEIVHQDIIFDAGFMEIQTFNNRVPWDASVRVLKKGKFVATTRTYAKSRAIEINPGTYDVSINAMKVEGEVKKIIIENVMIKANETTRVEHNFLTGTLQVGVNSAGVLVDATVRIFDKITGKSVVTARTYESADSNPKSFLLTEGAYRVEIKALKEYKGKVSAFDIQIKAGQEVKRMVKF